MTREEITSMAREAGFVGFDGENKCLRQFAVLVAAAEREACAMEAWELVLGLTDQDTADIVLRAIRARGEAK